MVGGEVFNILISTEREEKRDPDEWQNPKVMKKIA